MSLKEKFIDVNCDYMICQHVLFLSAPFLAGEKFTFFFLLYKGKKKLRTLTKKILQFTNFLSST